LHLSKVAALVMNAVSGVEAENGADSCLAAMAKIENRNSITQTENIGKTRSKATGPKAGCGEVRPQVGRRTGSLWRPAESGISKAFHAFILPAIEQVSNAPLLPNLEN
jgi:hypothetical protein